MDVSFYVAAVVKPLLHIFSFLSPFLKAVLQREYWVFPDPSSPGSRGSGRVREFFDEARLKPMSSR